MLCKHFRQCEMDGACWQPLGNELAAETRGGIQQCQSSVLFKMQSQEGRGGLDSLDFLLAAVLGKILCQMCLSHGAPRCLGNECEG